MPNIKPRASSSSHLEDALLDSILEIPESELDNEMKDVGLDPAQQELAVRAAIQKGINLARKGALAAARTGLANLRDRQLDTPRDTEAGRTLFERMKAGDPSVSEAMMMAARKGQKLSESDEAGIAEDLADLDRLSKDSE